jgi:hypothetical protein
MQSLLALRVPVLELRALPLKRLELQMLWREQGLPWEQALGLGLALRLWVRVSLLLLLSPSPRAWRRVSWLSQWFFWVWVWAWISWPFERSLVLVLEDSQLGNLLPKGLLTRIWALARCGVDERCVN